MNCRSCCLLLLALVCPPAVVIAQDVAGVDRAALVSRGQAVFERYCQPCHGSGPGDDGAPMLPGTHAIFLKHDGQIPPLLEDRADLGYEALRVFVRNGVASMPPFRKTELTDEDIAAIAAYFQESSGGQSTPGVSD